MRSIGIFSRIASTADFGIHLAERHDHVLVIVWIHPIIRIHKADIVSRGLIQSDIPRMADTVVLRVEDLDTRIPPRPRIAEFRAPVRGTIVNQQDFKIPIRLPNQGVQAIV